MKKYKKLISFIISIIIIVFFPLITYRIDSKLVSKDKRPIFVIRTALLKDGGTTIFKGVGYQVIKWNRMTVTGTEFGYEIYKYPNYRDVNDGPTKELKIITER